MQPTPVEEHQRTTGLTSLPKDGAHINDFEPTLEAVREARKKIKFRCDSTWSTMIDVLVGRGWTQVDDDDDTWHLYWNDVNKTAEILDSLQFETHQRIPHFRNHFELTRKNLLAKNLRHYKRYLHRQKCKRDEMAEIMPRTYEIPSEYAKFLADFDKSLGITWILKPASGRQGSGIFLFQDLKDLDDWRQDITSADDMCKTLAPKKSNPRIPRPDSIELPGVYIVQKYVERPYLIDGKKFDLRFYVLVTSVDLFQWLPLTVWLSRDGFARICGSKYSLENLRANRVHLTNMAIQLRPASQVDSVPGTKWKMQKLKSFLEAQHGLRMTAELMDRVAALVMTSLRSVAKRMRPDARCFELYGYDVLLDEKLKPWLLEVNASPSLNATGPEDYRMKYDLLSDVINIIDFEKTFTGYEGRIGGFDLLWRDGPVLTIRDPEGNEGDYDKIIGVADAFTVTDPSHPDRRLNAHLGEPNDRVQQLAVLKFQRQVVKLMASLPREPPWVPSESTTSPLPNDSHLVVGREEGGDLPPCDDLRGKTVEPEKLVWDDAVIAKVSDENVFGRPRKANVNEYALGKFMDGKAFSDSQPDEQDEFWRRHACKKPARRKNVGKKVTASKPTKANVKKVGGGKVTATNVAGGKAPDSKTDGGKVTDSKTVGENDTTVSGINEKVTPLVPRTQVTSNKTDEEGGKGDGAHDPTRVSGRLSDVREKDGKSEKSSEKCRPDSSSHLSRKMFGLTGVDPWRPLLVKD